MPSSAPSPDERHADLSALTVPPATSEDRMPLDTFLGLRSCAVDAISRVSNEVSRLIYLPWSHTNHYYMARADTVAELLEQFQGVEEVLLLEELHGFPRELKDLFAEIVESGATEGGEEAFLEMSLIPDSKKASYSLLFDHYRENDIVFRLRFIDTDGHSNGTLRTTLDAAMFSLIYTANLIEMFFEAPSKEMFDFVQRKGLTPLDQALELQGRHGESLAAILSFERNETMKKQVEETRNQMEGNTPILVSIGSAHICIARDTINDPTTAVTFIDLPEILLRHLPKGMRHHSTASLMLTSSIARVENESLFQEEDKLLLLAYMIEQTLKGSESKEEVADLTPLQATFNEREVQALLARTLALMTEPEERDKILREWEKQIEHLSPNEGFGKPIEGIIGSWLEATLGSQDRYTHCEKILERYLRVPPSSIEE